MMNLKIKNMVLCALFSALMIAGAYIKIPIPYYMPITFQNFVAVLSGLLLGPRLGAAATGVYMALGLLGLPVFAGGGGIGYILSPFFGYILGFVFAAFVSGLLIRKMKQQSFFNCLIAGVIGFLVVYLFGIPYNYIIAKFYLSTPKGAGALLMGTLLYLPGDGVKCLLCALFAPRLRRASSL